VEILDGLNISVEVFARLQSMFFLLLLIRKIH
jgi:hypothetical protein